jgi:DNA-binding CsgD family transcriptional regulator
MPTAAITTEDSCSKLAQNYPHDFTMRQKEIAAQTAQSVRSVQRATSTSASIKTHTMDKVEILKRLHAIASHRLFGGEWLADRDACNALNGKLVEMGLIEAVPDQPGTMRNTRLGKELRVDLFYVFWGLISVSDMPFILEEHGLIEEVRDVDAPIEELPEIWSVAWEDDHGEIGEQELREHVRRAYMTFCGAQRGLN